MAKIPVELPTDQAALRFLVSLWAYAYEMQYTSLVSDSHYDEAAMQVDTDVTTGDTILDTFFKEQFSPHTGMWIHHHPRLEDIAAHYRRVQGEPN